MAHNKKLKNKEPEEEIIVDLPDYHTVLGSDLNMVCTVKHLNDSSIKFICMSEDNEVLRYLVLCILDNCIDQIHILCGGRTGSGHLAFFNDVLKNKFTASKSLLFEPIYDRDTGEPYDVAFKRTRTNKPYDDGEKLKEFLVEVKYELKEFHSFELFRQVMYDVKIKKRDAKILLNQTIENQIKMRELKDAVVTQGRDSVLEIQKFNKAYAASCDSYQNLLIENLIQLRYAKEYEKSRIEQNQIKCDRELRELQNIISKYRIKMDNEHRVHDEILRFIDENQKDLKDNIKIWIEKYNKDMEHHHFLVLQIKDHLDDVKKMKQNLKIRFTEHKKAIKIFKEYKEKKRKMEEKYQKILKATIKIQAWWRGTLCRRMLRSSPATKSKKEKEKKKAKKTKKAKNAKETEAISWDLNLF